MSRGDAQFAVLFIAGETLKPEIIIPTAEPIPECCFILPLFGNSDFGNPLLFDEFKQDETSFFRPYDPNTIDSVELVIQKCENGIFVDKHTIIDNEFGIFKDLGDEIINGFSLVSLKNINWSKILLDFKAGEFRIKTNENSIFSSEPVQNDFSFIFDLKEFTANRADKTVFFKVSNDGSMGDRIDPRKRIVFPLGWEDGIRLPGEFGFDHRDYTKTFHRFESGKKVFSESTGTKKFTFKGKPITEEARKFFANELMMADLVEITDYNKNNANTHIKTPVHGDGEFSPTYSPNTIKAFFDVEFTDAFDNNIKKHCIT